METTGKSFSYMAPLSLGSDIGESGLIVLIEDINDLSQVGYILNSSHMGRYRLLYVL